MKVWSILGSIAGMFLVYALFSSVARSEEVRIGHQPIPYSEPFRCVTCEQQRQSNQQRREEYVRGPDWQGIQRHQDLQSIKRSIDSWNTYPTNPWSK